MAGRWPSIKDIDVRSSSQSGAAESEQTNCGKGKRKDPQTKENEGPVSQLQTARNGMGTRRHKRTNARTYSQTPNPQVTIRKNIGTFIPFEFPQRKHSRQKMML
jgi:hypothetical protein